jgi:hypothetical protein
LANESPAPPPSSSDDDDDGDDGDECESRPLLPVADAVGLSAYDDDRGKKPRMTFAFHVFVVVRVPSTWSTGLAGGRTSTPRLDDVINVVMSTRDVCAI